MTDYFPMMMKKIMYGGLLLTSLTSAHAQQLTESFKVSTFIDKSKIYPYSIELQPEINDFILRYDESLRAFKNRDINLFIKTDIPNSEASLGFGYNLNLLENLSQCRSSIDDSVTQEGFIRLFIDNVLFDESTPAADLKLSTSPDSETLSGQNRLTVSSLPIEQIMQICSGTINIEGELSL